MKDRRAFNVTLAVALAVNLAIVVVILWAIVKLVHHFIP